MRILLIEDNPDHVFLARQAIEEIWRDATLHVVRDLAEVQSLLDSPACPTHFDLLLVALNGLDTDRLARLRALQAAPAIHATPIIALASSTRDRELAQVADQPLDWIILKPLHAEALREAIRRRPLP